MKKITETSDFKELIEGNNLYIDKTLFIKDFIDSGDKSLMITRARRFGKSLNISMLYYYFSNEFDSKKLFEGLNISKEDAKYLDEMNKYPTIFLSLKDTKYDNYEGFIDNYKEVMKSLYAKYDYLLKSDKLDETDKEDFMKIIRKQEDILLPNALSKLVKYLSKYYESQVIVLLDEYDAPILYGYEKGYYDKIISFMKQLFVTTFKPDPVDSKLKRGFITGVTRISKENMFSDANNIIVYNITDSMYSEYFGFTESEVKELLKEYDLSDNFNDIKKWYDGYLFSDTTIYNPWSILSYLRNVKHELKPYWVNTGGVDLIKKLIYNLNNKLEILNIFEKLLERGTIEHINLNVNLDLSNLAGDKDNIYTLFMLCGYLTPVDNILDYEDLTLRIPNLEIRKNLENIVIDWFRSGPLKNYDFTSYLTTGQIELFKEDFKNIVEESFSYYDVPNTNNGENFYHAFTLGLLRSSSSEFEITSNRESGYGRYDLMLKPINSKYAYIIEFKVSGSDFDKTIEEGFKQIDEQKYDLSLKDYNVIKMVIAFRGKKIKIETR